MWTKHGNPYLGDFFLKDKQLSDHLSMRKNVFSCFKITLLYDSITFPFFLTVLFLKLIISLSLGRGVRLYSESNDGKKKPV